MALPRHRDMIICSGCNTDRGVLWLLSCSHSHTTWTASLKHHLLPMTKYTEEKNIKKRKILRREQNFFFWFLLRTWECAKSPPASHTAASFTFFGLYPLFQKTEVWTRPPVPRASPLVVLVLSGVWRWRWRWSVQEARVARCCYCCCCYFWNFSSWMTLCAVAPSPYDRCASSTGAQQSRERKKTV